MEKQIKTIGVLTSGGDAPGMNAAVRAVVRAGLHKGFRMIGIQRGYNGLLDGECFEMNLRSVSNIISAGGIELNKSAHQVKIDGKDIELSFKEFELLAYFMENQGIALSREKILNNVWNYDYFGDARTIDTHVKKLRSKLGEKGELIKTIWGMGYKFEP